MRKWLFARLILGFAIVTGFALLIAPIAQAAPLDRSILPIPPAPFKGTIKKTYEGSVQDYPQPVKPPKGAPNVVVILIDDLGFGQPSTFGGPVPTPKLDSLAAEGLRYNRFHTTSICSPTRAALLTGRNHHQVGFGTITELSTGYPGYNSVWPRSTASVAEILKDNGYSTAAFGKWHNTPDWETSPIGPFGHWPTNLGFEYWYGFQGGESSQWEPQLFRGTTPVEPPLRPEQGYNLNVDLVNDAISWINRQQSVSPDKPYFVYFAPGAVHAPLHVSKEWIEKFKGKFDEGWDKERAETLARQKKLGVVPENTDLTPRPDSIPAWDSLDADAKRLYARQQEVFAGYLAQTDYEVGRLIDAVHALPDGDNTLIIYVAGDNGPSAEGTLTGTINNIMTQNGVPDTVANQLPHIDEIGSSPEFENHYAVGWAWAGSSPFQWMKRVAAYFGGTRNGMVISWPKRIHDEGGLRSQFHHVVDIAPTILEAAGIKQPTEVNGVKQEPMAGVSMEYTFDKPDAPGRHHVQYFEVEGQRAIYKDGWVAASFHGVPWQMVHPPGFKKKSVWCLYNIDKDFSEDHDLAAQYPKKLAELKSLFDEEARKYHVYPLDDRWVARAINPARPSFVRGRTSFTYSPGTDRIPEGNAPPIYQRSHKITASIEVPETGGNGVIVAEGGAPGGYTLYLDNGVPVYEYNFFDRERYRVVGKAPLAPGRHTIVLDYKQTQPFTRFKDLIGGPAELSVDGQQVAKGNLAKVVPGRFSATETLDIGKDFGSPVSKDYSGKSPFAFNGKIYTVKIELE